MTRFPRNYILLFKNLFESRSHVSQTGLELAVLAKLNEKNVLLHFKVCVCVGGVAGVVHVSMWMQVPAEARRRASDPL